VTTSATLVSQKLKPVSRLPFKSIQHSYGGDNGGNEDYQSKKRPREHEITSKTKKKKVADVKEKKNDEHHQILARKNPHVLPIIPQILAASSTTPSQRENQAVNLETEKLADLALQLMKMRERSAGKTSEDVLFCLHDFKYDDRKDSYHKVCQEET
jgi:hypothetical protein